MVVDNNHPIYDAPLIGVHNGVIWNNDELREEYFTEAEVDSAVILSVLNAHMGDGKLTLGHIRKAMPSHAWYQPEYDAPLRPLTQFFGIAAGISLLWFMGIEAVIGAATAAIVGFSIFQSYGRKHYNIEITPWETFRSMFTDPGEVEHRRRLAAFHAADLESTNHLNLREFVGAMRALGYDKQDFSQRSRPLRDYFHAADEDGDGVIDIDEFLAKAEEMMPGV